jgi:RecA-family ATPase
MQHGAVSSAGGFFAMTGAGTADAAEQDAYELSPLAEAVAKIARHCSRGTHWFRTPQGPRHVDQPLRKKDLDLHVNGGPRRGVACILPGESTTKIAVLDFDSHKGEVSWDAMRAIVKKVMAQLRAQALEPLPFRSSGGKGIHLYLLWNEPQDAFSVRELLRSALESCELKPGTKGVKHSEVEIFPKQDSVPRDGYGSMFYLPLSGESLPLDTTTLELESYEYAEAATWPRSRPVPVLERAPVERPALPKLDANLGEIKAMLDAIPNDGGADSPDYDRWRDIVFAVHDGTGGSEEGLALVHDFSSRNPKYEADFINERVWPHIRSDRQGKTITLRSLAYKAREHGYVEDTSKDFEVLPPAEAPSPIEYSPGGEKHELIDPNTTRLGDVFSIEPPEPRFIVSGLLPESAGVENAIGGAGKSTRHHYEAAHLILGRPLYGRRTERSGAYLLVTREDDAAIVRYRMNRIARALDLNDADKKRLAASFHVLDLVGGGDRLVQTDRKGNLVRTPLVERICRSYEREGLVLVDFDPIGLLGPGEKHVNDGEGAMLDAGHAISRALGAAVRFTSHVSKVVGREGIVDAHSGRGGSALGDNARFVWNYVTHEKEHKEHRPPVGAREAALRGNLYRLHISKLSWARPPRSPIWIERDGYSFTMHEGAPETTQDRLQTDAERVVTFLEAEAGRGARYSRNELESAIGRIAGEGTLSRPRLRDAVNELLRTGQVGESDLPASERRGGRKTYLEAKPADLAVNSCTFGEVA